jgi:hypothetical protein
MDLLWAAVIASLAIMSVFCIHLYEDWRRVTPDLKAGHGEDVQAMRARQLVIDGRAHVLLGLTKEQVNTFLGKPTATFNDYGQDIWRYGPYGYRHRYFPGPDSPGTPIVLRLVFDGNPPRVQQTGTGD